MLYPLRRKPLYHASPIHGHLYISIARRDCLSIGGPLSGTVDRLDSPSEEIRSRCPPHLTPRTGRVRSIRSSRWAAVDLRTAPALTKQSQRHAEKYCGPHPAARQFPPWDCVIFRCESLRLYGAGNLLISLRSTAGRFQLTPHSRRLPYNLIRSSLRSLPSSKKPVPCKGTDEH